MTTVKIQRSQYKAYLETSVFSFLHEVRKDPHMVAWRETTQSWWDADSTKATFVSSLAVVNELSKGYFPSRNACLETVKTLPMLSVTQEVLDVAKFYVQHKVMPADPLGDALHLAIASFYRCDFLVTWNCKHLANAKKFGHIRKMNHKLGLFVPSLVTPLELSGEGLNE